MTWTLFDSERVQVKKSPSYEGSMKGTPRMKKDKKNGEISLERSICR